MFMIEERNGARQDLAKVETRIADFSKTMKKTKGGKQERFSGKQRRL